MTNKKSHFSAVQKEKKRLGSIKWVDLYLSFKMQVPFGTGVKLMGMQSNWSYMKLRFEFLLRMRIFFFLLSKCHLLCNYELMKGASRKKIDDAH